MSTRYICFSLGQEEFAVPLMEVREVIALPDVTPLAHVPVYFKGIINLRGQIITVIDLRQKLNIKPSSQSENTIIICDLHPYMLGVLIDSVNDVLTIDDSQLSEKPDVVGVRNSDYVSKVYQTEDKFILFINLPKALGFDMKFIHAPSTEKRIS